MERRKREAVQGWKEKECKTKPSCSQALPCCCCSPPRGAAVSPLPEFEAFPLDLTSSGSTSSSPSIPWRPAGAPCCGGSGWLTGFKLNILSLTNHIITCVPQPFDRPQIHGIRRFAHFFLTTLQQSRQWWTTANGGTNQLQRENVERPPHNRSGFPLAGNH